MGLTKTASGLLVSTPDTEYPYSCPWCDTNFTDEEFQDRTYVRHVERCVDMDKVEEHIHVRKSDPISIRDEEQITFLRDQQANRKLRGVVGKPSRRKP